MKKYILAISLLTCYAAYSGWVYTYGTNCRIEMSPEAAQGKAIWQQRNCQSCHQIYGLGGYMGPELTQVVSEKGRGVAYTRAMLMNGGYRMPNFHFSEREADQLLAYLSYVNVTYRALKQ